MRLIPWIAGAVVALAAIVVLYPGQYSFDSAYQLWQARTGQFSNISPAAMSATWAALLELVGDPAALLCLNLVLFYAGLVLCVEAISRSASVRLTLLIVFGLAPLTLVEMAHLLSDAHLAAVLVLASGLTAAACIGRTRLLWPAVGLLLYAGCLRHNALVTIAPLGALIALELRRPAGGWREGVAGAMGIVMLSGACALAFDRALVQHRVSVWPTIALWDLAAISVDHDTLLLPSFTHGAGLDVREIERSGAFNPASNTVLFDRTSSGIRDGFAYPYSSDELADLRAAWLRAVRRYPMSYLHHRLRAAWLLIAPHRGEASRWTYYVDRVPYRDNPPLPLPVAPAAQRWVYVIAAGLASTWLFAALPYLLCSLAALTIGWIHRGQPAGRIAAAVSASALLYAGTFVPFAPGAELRYMTWPIIAGPLALAFACTAMRHRIA